jgi:hypothetical protein
MQQGQGTGNGLSVLATSINLAATNILIEQSPNCFILSERQSTLYDSSIVHLWFPTSRNSRTKSPSTAQANKQNIYPKELNPDIMKPSYISPNTITMVLYMLNECNASNHRHAPEGQIQ